MSTKSRRGYRVPEHSNLFKLVFFPSYSPERNPDKYLNGDIKASLGRKPSPLDQKTLERNLKSHMRMRSKSQARVVAYFQVEHVRYAAAALRMSLLILAEIVGTAAAC